MKKGRHRRFEEARALKRGPDVDIERVFEEPEVEDPDREINGRSGWYDDEDTAEASDN